MCRIPASSLSTPSISSAAPDVSVSVTVTFSLLSVLPGESTVFIGDEESKHFNALEPSSSLCSETGLTLTGTGAMSGMMGETLPDTAESLSSSSSSSSMSLSPGKRLTGSMSRHSDSNN